MDTIDKLQRLAVLGKVTIWSAEPPFPYVWTIKFKGGSDNVTFGGTGLTLAEAIDNLLQDMQAYLDNLNDTWKNIEAALKAVGYEMTEENDNGTSEESNTVRIQEFVGSPDSGSGGDGLHA